MGALYLVSRITHVGTAIIAVGGMFFIRFVLMPAATATLADADHEKLRARVMATWKRVVHISILLFLLSGGINYTRVILEKTHKGDAYHPLIGTKIILAFVIFFIASALVGRSAKFEPMRKNSKKWITVNLALAAVIIIISGYLRLMPPKSVPAQSAPAIQSASQP